MGKLSQLFGNCRFSDSVGRVWKIRTRPIRDLESLRESIVELKTNNYSVESQVRFIYENVEENHDLIFDNFPAVDVSDFIQSVITANFGDIDDIDIDENDERTDEEKENDYHDSLVKMIGAFCESYYWTPDETMNMTIHQIKAIIKFVDYKKEQEYKTKGRADTERRLKEMMGGDFSMRRI